jgi:hypothetical protein
VGEDVAAAAGIFDWVDDTGEGLRVKLAVSQSNTLELPPLPATMRATTGGRKLLTRDGIAGG